MSTNLTPFLDWDFADGHVQDRDTVAGDFLSSESVVLVAGPAEYSDSTSLVPIGLVQNAQVSQNKQMQQLFEIGSRMPFFIPGRTIIQCGISRVLFDGPSLMKAMSVEMKTAGLAYTGFDSSGTDVPDTQKPALPYSNTPDTDGDFFINLASKFFNKPLGIGFVLHDMENDPYGGFYLENCYFQTHSFSLAGQQTVLLENVGIRASGMVPLNVGPV